MPEHSSSPPPTTHSPLHFTPWSVHLLRCLCAQNLIRLQNITYHSIEYPKWNENSVNRPKILPMNQLGEKIFAKFRTAIKESVKSCRGKDMTIPNLKFVTSVIKTQLEIDGVRFDVFWRKITATTALGFGICSTRIAQDLVLDHLWFSLNSWNYRDG